MMEIAITPINGFIFHAEDLVDNPENYDEDELREIAVQFIRDSEPAWVVDSLDWEAEIIG